MQRLLFLSAISLITVLTFGQEKQFVGNWAASSNWSFHYYQIKKNNRVNKYTEGCTDRGTNHPGTWKAENDTITLSFEKSTVRFYLKDGELYSFTPNSKGIKRTHCSSIRGARQQRIRERNKERKERYTAFVPDSTTSKVTITCEDQ